MERHDDQAVPRHRRQHVADEAELLRPEPALVLAGAVGLGAEVLDVVQHQERGAGILEAWWRVPYTRLKVSREWVLSGASRLILWLPGQLCQGRPMVPTMRL